MLEVEARIGEPLEIYLRREYETNEKSTLDLSDATGFSSKTIFEWLKLLGIQTRSRSQSSKLEQEKRSQRIRARVEEQAGEPLDSFLQREYSQNDLLSHTIAARLDTTHKNVLKWLYAAGIEVRDKEEALSIRAEVEARIGQKLDHYLAHHHYDLGKKPYQLAHELGITRTTVGKFIRELEQRTRDNISPDLLQFVDGRENEDNAQVKIAPIEELKRLRGEGKTLKEIGAVYNIHERVVSKWLKQAGMQTDKRGMYSDKDERKKALELLLTLSNKDARDLNSKEFIKTKRDDGVSFQGLMTWYRRAYECSTTEAIEKMTAELYDISPEERRTKIVSNGAFIRFLQQDETARNLATVALALNGEASDIEHVINEVYNERFGTAERVHQLLQENRDEASQLFEESMTNLGVYLGNFSLSDRAIIPILLGNAVEAIDDDKITVSLEDKLVRVLRASYGPQFNENPQQTVETIRARVSTLPRGARRIYERLENHYQNTLALQKEVA